MSFLKYAKSPLPSIFFYDEENCAENVYNQANGALPIDSTNIHELYILFHIPHN